MLFDIFKNRKRKNEESRGETLRVFLNFHPNDAVYTVGMRQMRLDDREMVFISEDNFDLNCNGNEKPDIIVSFVTERFKETKKNKAIIEAAYKNDIRRISVVFCKEPCDELYGDLIICESEVDYFAETLYSMKKFSKYLGKKENHFIQSIKSAILNDAQPALPVNVADEKTLIFAIGSAGFSLVKCMLEEIAVINGQLVFVKRSAASDKGQPHIYPERTIEWNLELESEVAVDDKDDRVEVLKAKIGGWFEANVKNKYDKIIIVAGLGKTTSSLIAPMITDRAINMGIPVKLFVTLPFEFEPDNNKEVAAVTLSLLSTMTNEIIVYDNSVADRKNSFDKQASMLSFGAALCMNRMITASYDKIHRLEFIDDSTADVSGKEVLGKYRAKRLLLSAV